MIYRVSLFGLPGFTTVGAAVFDSSYVPAVTDTDIDLLTGEISTGDASGYARLTNIAVTWDAGTYRLDIDTPGDTFDLDGASDVATLVFYDPSDDALISWVPITPHAGFDGWPIPVATVADIADTGTLGVQVTNLDGRVTALENNPGGGGVPDPSGEDDGDVLTVSSGAAIWAPPSGGGGSTPPSSPTVWLSTGSHYVDRDRVWLGGLVAHDSSGGGTIGSLPEGARPASTRPILGQVVNDADGTPAVIPAEIVVQSDGAVTVLPASSSTLVGTVGVFLDGLSFRIEDPA